MKRGVARIPLLFLVLLIGLAFLANVAEACTSCYGKSDSPLAQGMNMGIMTLLGFVGAVLFGISAFFVYLARRSAMLSSRPPSTQVLESTHN